MLRKIVAVPLLQVTGLKAKLFLSVLSSLFLVLSFPRSNIWLLAWVGFVPLFFSLTGLSKGKAFVCAYLAGALFWLGVIYWLIHVTLLGLVLLVLYLALYVGVFGVVVLRLQAQESWLQVFVIPAAWVVLEYIRSNLFTGFPWALLGYSQYLNLPAIQICDITGAWGVSFLVMMVNVSIWQITHYLFQSIDKKQKPFYAVHYLAPVLLVCLSLGYGFYQLHRVQYPGSGGAATKVCIIQGNIPQELKWNPRARDFIVSKYLNLSASACQEKPALIIWPEAALPVIPEEEPEIFKRVKDFVKEKKVPLLLGAVTQRAGSYHNSALLISGKGEVVLQYNKLHLVPFGEYIPLRRLLPFMETVVPIGDIERGKEYIVFQIPASSPQDVNKFAILICFEDLFPELSRHFIKHGADFLVTITNDAWYEKTSAAYQHFQASVFRAVENRVVMVRCANTGVSGYIAPTGRIISLVQEAGKEIFVDGYKTELLAATKAGITVYGRFGDVFILICIFVAGYGIIRPSKKRNVPQLRA